MARSLIDHGVLSGLRRQGVTDLLGEPDSAPVGDAGSSLVYSLGGNLVLSLRLGPDGRLNEQGVYLRQ
jgi:hypothetical protein